MVLTPLFITACLSFQGPGNTACNTTLNQISDESKLTSMLNLLETRAREDIEKSTSHEIIYGLTVLGSAINMYSTKTITAQIPFGQFEFDTNLTFNSDNYLLKYHLDW